MRVVALTPEYPPAPHLGGIGSNAAALAPALARRGHDVTVIVPAAPGERGSEAVAGGVRVVRMVVRRVPAAVPGHDILERLLFRVAVARRCRRLRADVVHVPEWEALAWPLVLLPTAVVTMLATPTHIVDELNDAGQRRDPARTVVTWWERDQTRRSAAVYAPSAAIVARVAADWGIPAERMQVLSNPVDVDAVRSAGAGEPPIAVGEEAVVFIGRIERRKGVDTLAAALEKVLADRRHASAVLIGRAIEDDVALVEEVHRRLDPFGNRVQFAGELAWPVAMSVLARASVVVLPSRWENSPYVCVEAMALGRPVVASDIGGFSEIIEHGSTGWLVPAGDDAALAGALLSALADGPGRAAVGGAASARADDFAADGVAPVMEALLERAVASRRRAPAS